MTERTRKGWLLAAGLLLTALLAWWAWRHWMPAEAPVPVVAGNETIIEPAGNGTAPAAATPDTVPLVATPAGGCDFEPLVASGVPRDGQFSLQAALATGASAGPAAFLRVAQEAAGEGRSRDAEVALIVACRVAAQTAGWPSAPVADVKVELGQHYADVGARERATGPRLELLRRAESLLTESVAAYGRAIGKNASKTVLAGQRLAAVTQAAAQVTLAPPGEAAATQQDPAAATLGAAKAMADSQALAQQEAASAFGCGSARSEAERTVCADPELTEMERDLDRLRTQARSVTRDPGGFAQRQEQAWAQRDTQCKGDKACLRNWYAQRKRQLFTEF